MPSRNETCWPESVSSQLALLHHFMLETREQSRGPPGRLNFSHDNMSGQPRDIGTPPSSRTHLLRHIDKAMSCR